MKNNYFKTSLVMTNSCKGKQSMPKPFSENLFGNKILSLRGPNNLPSYHLTKLSNSPPIMEQTDIIGYKIKCSEKDKISSMS